VVQMIVGSGVAVGEVSMVQDDLGRQQVEGVEAPGGGGVETGGGGGGPAVATSTGGSASGSPHAPGALKPDVGGVAGLGASVAGEDSSNLPGTAVTGPSAGRCTVMDPASSTVDDRRSVGQGGEDILQVSGRLIRAAGEGGGVGEEGGGGGEWRGGWWGVGSDMAGPKNNQPGGTGKAATSCIDQGVCGGGGKVHDEGNKGEQRRSSRSEGVIMDKGGGKMEEK
ncbi:hypothetical protein CYMTET_21243, partial [Cymbomonas tetramitiformis]